MRTIKFRGKRVDNEEWVYGSTIIQIDSNNELFVYIAERGQTVDPIFDHKGNIVALLQPSLVRVIQETVGQFTGLTDKNGKEIYEGDIVWHRLQGNRVVYYPFSFDTASFGLLHQSGYANLLTDASNLYEVIGNIHDNQELLK